MKHTVQCTYIHTIRTCVHACVYLSDRRTLHMYVIDDETDLTQFAFKWKSKVFSNGIFSPFLTLNHLKRLLQAILIATSYTRNMIYKYIQVKMLLSQSELHLIDLALARHNLPVGISSQNGVLEYIYAYALPFGHFKLIIIKTGTLNNLQWRDSDDVRKTQYAKWVNKNFLLVKKKKRYISNEQEKMERIFNAFISS